MSYPTLAYVHLATVLPAFVLGTILLLRHKGTPAHRAMGRIYMGLMLATGLITLAMPATVGPKLLGHFGWLHLFSAMTLVTVPRAWFDARAGNVAGHRGNMIGLYIGGLVIAGSFAFGPGRLLHRWLFG